MMPEKELQYRCETCNIELVVIDRFSRSFKECFRTDIRKFYKHVKKGHKIESEFFSVFRDYENYNKISEQDTVTSYILENESIIIP